MKPVLALVAALALATPSQAQAPTLWSDAIPPARYQRPTIVPVAFLPADQVSEICSRNLGPVPAGMVVMACTGTMDNGQPLIVMPDPCPAGQQEYYARILCHELSHANGWPANHPF